MKSKVHISIGNKRLETLIYSGLWILAFMLFLLDAMRERSYTESQLLNFATVVRVAYNMLPFLVLFSINNYLLIRFFLKRGRYSSYVLAVILLIAVVWLWQRAQFLGSIKDDVLMTRPRPVHPGPAPLLPLPLFLSIIYDVFIIGVNLAISMIFQNFNDRLEQEQLKKENAENQLSYLKAQINPHFYMNMLNNIHGMIEINPMKAQDMVIEMSRLMRYMLYESSRPLIGLNAEVNFIRDYLGIMRVRFPEDMVAITAKLPDEKETMGILVPPLLFLVFIENAFKHGVSYTGNSFISVCLTTEDGKITFQCMNSVNKLANHSEATGIGLENVKRRMDIIYGDRYVLDINSRENIYSVNLIIPIDETPRSYN